MFKNKKILDNSIKNILLICGINTIFYVLNQISFFISCSLFVTEYNFSFKGHILDYLLYISFACFIVFLTNSIVCTNCFFTIFYFIFTIISCLKLNYIYQPIYLSDLNFLNNGIGEITSLVNKEVILSCIKIIFPYFFSNFILLFLLFFVFFLIKVKINKREKIYGCIISILLFFIFLLPCTVKLFIDYNNEEFGVSKLYSQYGLIAGIYSYDLYSQISEPNNYNEEKVKDILNNYKSDKTVNSWGNPNVIIVLSESFFDISKLNEITFNKDIFEDYNYVKEKSKTFNIISSTYAGKTGNIEFEFNTLSSNKYLAEAIVPFNVFYGQDNMLGYPSIIKILNDNGYVTSIYSPFDEGEVYNLVSVYPKLGYQNMYFFSDLQERTTKNIVKGFRFCSDENLINFVIEDFEKTQEPSFTFVKTVQNHMPYYLDRYYENGIDISEIKAYNSEGYYLYNEIELKHFSAYGQGIYDNGKMLRDLYEYVQNVEKPTVVVFFGDHLPNITDITNTGRDLLKDGKFLNSENDLENLFNQYCTEGLIFSNYEIDTSDIKNYMSYDLLGNYILKHLNVDKGNFTNYSNFLYDTMYELPTSNRLISVFENKALIETLNIEENLKNVYNLRGYLQYYYLKNNYK